MNSITLLTIAYLFNSLAYLLQQKNEHITVEKIEQTFYHYQTTEHDTLLLDIFYIEKPLLKTSNTGLKKMFDKEIQTLFSIPTTTNSLLPYPLYKFEIQSTLEYPAENVMNYNVNFENQNLMSITVHKHWIASNGTSGANHNFFPLTFDLSTHKVIRFNDAIQVSNMDLAINILIAQIEQHSYNGYTLKHELDNDIQAIHRNCEAIQNRKIGVSDTDIFIYHAFSYGGKRLGKALKINIERNQHLFKKNFLKKYAQ